MAEAGSPAVARARREAYRENMLRLLRLAILIVLVVWILGLVIAVGRPETGPLEDVVLVALVAGSFALAAPVRRIGRHANGA